MTYKQFVDSATLSLTDIYPKSEARAASVRLLCSVLSIPDYKYLSSPSETIPEKALMQLNSSLEQLVKGCPLQYVLGFTEFFGLKIRVAPGVLIPRPETEELVSIIVDECSSIELEEDSLFNVLDLCTGSGCIAYALADSFPQACVYGCDISDEALRIACRQKVRIAGTRPVFFKADILNAPPCGLPKFNLMVSNPPYICESERALMRSNVVDYEPEEALFVPDGNPLVHYVALRRWADELLVDGGLLYMEINERFPEEVSSIFDGAEVIADLSSKPRFVRYRKQGMGTPSL